MFSIIHRRVLKKDGIFATKYAVFSLRKSSSYVCGGDPNRSFTVSYLINSCGLPEKDALAASKKLRIDSRENPDAVLELLADYGFTNARSIGVPDAVSANKISIYPGLMKRSLEKFMIPMYNDLKSLVHSDERVARVFARAPRAFVNGWGREFSSNIATLRQRGVPDSCIVPFLVNQPSLMLLSEDKFTACVDWAAEMGFDLSTRRFLGAVKVFACMSERTLKHKRDVYGRCGWSESEVAAAVLRSPDCMMLSEKKIRASVDFLVNELGLEVAAVARHPLLLSLNVDRK